MKKSVRIKMKSDIKKTWKLFYWLMRRDLTIFLRDYKGYLFNVIIWIVIDIGVFAYLMPYFGLKLNFGTFIVAGIIASLGMFEAMHSATLFADDLENDKQVTYDLTLPVSSNLIFIQRATLYTCRMILLSVFVIPLSKLFFWYKIELVHFSFLKFTLIFLSFNIMYGFFGLWMVSFIKEMEDVRDIWTRIVFPLWFLGGYQFSWQAMYAVAPILSYLALLNPITYAMEGARVAILGQSNFLNFWLCLGALAFFAILFGMRGIYLLRKRLDCV